MSEKLYALLSEHLTPRKKKLFEEILSQRTRHFTIVLEDVYQAQNTSAILRSAEAWGIQDLHVIENRHVFSHHRRIARGANDWLTIHRYNKAKDNSAACFENLKKKGYRIVVTSFGEDAVPLSELDLGEKIAVVMGTELKGASETALACADEKIVIPMYGFTESLNVSVAAAVIMQNVTSRLRSENRVWQLSEEEKLELRVNWAKRSITWSDYLVEMYEAGELK